LNDNWASSVKAETLDENLLRQFAYCSAGNICPLQAVIGGIAAQEIMKVSFSIQRHNIETNVVLA